MPRCATLFLAFDTDHSGEISLQEFKKTLEDRFDISDDAASAAFLALDSNGTDKIQYNEFLAGVMHSRIQLHDDLLGDAFRRFDKDNSGFISIENLREVLGDSFGDADVEKWLAEADTSHDGRIDYGEWIEYVGGGGSASEAAAGIVDRKSRQKSIRMSRKVAVDPHFHEAMLDAATSEKPEELEPVVTMSSGSVPHTIFWCCRPD